MPLKLSCSWSSAKIWNQRGLMLKMTADFSMVTVSSSLSPQATTARCILSTGCTFRLYLMGKKTTFPDSFSIRQHINNFWPCSKAEVQNFYSEANEHQVTAAVQCRTSLTFWPPNRPFSARVPHQETQNTQNNYFLSPPENGTYRQCSRYTGEKLVHCSSFPKNARPHSCEWGHQWFESSIPLP